MSKVVCVIMILTLYAKRLGYFAVKYERKNIEAIIVPTMKYIAIAEGKRKKN